LLCLMIIPGRNWVAGMATKNSPFEGLGLPAARCGHRPTLDCKRCPRAAGIPGAPGFGLVGCLQSGAGLVGRFPVSRQSIQNPFIARNLLAELSETIMTRTHVSSLESQIRTV